QELAALVYLYFIYFRRSHVVEVVLGTLIGHVADDRPVGVLQGESEGIVIDRFGHLKQVGARGLAGEVVHQGVGVGNDVVAEDLHAGMAVDDIGVAAAPIDVVVPGKPSSDRQGRGEQRPLVGDAEIDGIEVVQRRVAAIGEDDQASAVFVEARPVGIAVVVA